ncbi:MAG: DUF255 domain-containing protein [Rhodoferax sp.]|nr:DUF255 domain-containing protein [Rhodoferax sp.]
MSNRRFLKTSPYIRQHAGSPVDRYPWEEEAFRRAREEDKPVHLAAHARRVPGDRAKLIARHCMQAP